MKWPRSLAVVGCALALQGPREPDDARIVAALRDYRAGRYQTAVGVLRSELELRGEAAPPELRLNVAIAELRLLRSRDAEEVLAELADTGTGSADRAPAHAADVAFLLGIAAWQHAERAVTAAQLADAEPMAWPLAVRSIERCELQFQRAAELREPWPEAVRNAERAWHKRQQIEQLRAAAETPESQRESVPEPPPPEQNPPDGPPEAVVPDVAVQPLSAAEVEKMQQRVREQQQQKVRRRQQSTRRTFAVGERDW